MAERGMPGTALNFQQVGALVETAAAPGVSGTVDFLSLDAGRNLRVTPAPYPAGATPITASAVGTTGAITATLAAAAGKTTFLTGLVVTYNNPTAAVNATITIANVVTGSLVFGANALATGAAVPLPPPFFLELDWPLPASAPNTAITITLSALGAGGIGQVNAIGFQL